MEFRERRLAEDLWYFEQEGARCFLLRGEPYSLLVDACFGGALRPLCEARVGGPIRLVLTHGDRDHIGCMDQFERRFLHPAEYAAMEERTGVKPHAEPIWEGEVLALGGFRLEVLHLPGHTPGSIALLERDRRFLIGGDSVQCAPVYMYGVGRSLEAYRDSLAKLRKLRGAFDLCYASHGQVAVDAEIVDELFFLTDEICRGRPPAPLPAPRPGPPTMPDSARLYTYRRAQLVL